MVDHRHTLGECGRSYPCYILKLLKIALVVVSGTQSPAAVDDFPSARQSMVFQVHGRRCFIMCTAVDIFSGAWSHLD